MIPWRDAASIILAANFKQNLKEQINRTTHDYKLLSLKRSKTSSFLPGSHVFPGGTVDPADLDVKWKDLYKRYGINDKHFASLFPSSSSPRKKRPLIFKMDTDVNNKLLSQQLPKEISLRITAIRETFEECGILLCKASKERVFSKWAEGFLLNHAELKAWQHKVHENSTEFYNMCEMFDCYPDLWALNEWGNWLTPTSLGGKRFDTIFFMACMKSIPDTEVEVSEIDELSWDFPDDLIQHSAKFKLVPPQIYEISKISKFNCLNNLLDHAIECNKAGVDLKLAVLVTLSDGVVFLLPGDTEYPANVSLISSELIDHSNLSIVEFRNSAGAKNRVEILNSKNRPRQLIKSSL